MKEENFYSLLVELNNTIFFYEYINFLKEYALYYVLNEKFFCKIGNQLNL